MKREMTTHEDLERYLLANPMMGDYRTRVQQSLMLFHDRPLMRFELILDITIVLLEEISDQINELKPKFGVEEK
jgi:hypothetical protein